LESSYSEVCYSSVAEQILIISQLEVCKARFKCFYFEFKGIQGQEEVEVCLFRLDVGKVLAVATWFTYVMDYNLKVYNSTVQEGFS